MGKSTISMAIFNSYVSLPEGNMTKSKRISNHLPNRKEWFDMVEHGGFFGSSSWNTDENWYAKMMKN